MTKSFYVAALALPLTLLSACSGDSETGVADTIPMGESNNSELANGGSGVDNNENSTSMPAPNDTELNPAGEPADYFGVFERACNPEFRDSGSLTLSADSLVLIDTVFEDEACTEALQEQVVTYSVVYPSGVTNTELGEAIHVDLVLEAWVIDAELVNSQQSNGPFYQIIFHDGVMLYLGDKRGETVAQRPTALSSTAYIRQ